MTTVEWEEICEWVRDHWHKEWAAEHQVEWFHDLKGYDSSDVWAAVYHLYEAGSAFPPNGSQLLARCIVERRTTAQADVYRALPEARGEPAYTSDYAKKRFGESMTGMQLIERIHSELPRKKCGNTACGLHKATA